jgi:hypothetical protein
VRALLLPLLGTLVGAAMVAGGVWGIAADAGDDSGSSSSDSIPKTSSAKDCAEVAERDPRFRAPHDLQFGADGHATVQCQDDRVLFSVDIDSGVLKPQTFYKIVLERGRREREIGTLLTPPSGFGDSPTTATAPPDVRLRGYDFLTIRQDEFFAGKGEPVDEPLRAPL